MQQHVRSDCPKCSRPLTKFNGHIGYCPQHKWVSPFGLGFDAEAEAQNYMDRSAEEKKRLDEERERYEAEVRLRNKKKRKALQKALLITGIFLVILALIAFFLIRPGMNYKKSLDRFTAGEFSSARDGFESLGNYKDSAQHLLLCEALLDMQANRTEDAKAKLQHLMNDREERFSDRFADSLLYVIGHRSEIRLNPKILLMLLENAGLFDFSGTLDIGSLSVEGHISLLGGAQRSVCLLDMDADGTDDLIALNRDFSVSAYKMSADGNLPVRMDNAAMAACAMTFAKGFGEADPDSAIACYSEAYRLLPNEETRVALTRAYRARSASYEKTGDMTRAINDAYSALQVSDHQEEFAYFYNISLTNCRNGNDTPTAIQMWNDFAEAYQSEIVRHSAYDLWRNDAALLHKAYASELASLKKAECLDELRTAASLGADVRDALEEACTHFHPGFTLANLRLFALELYQDDAEKSEQIRLAMSEEIRRAISDWKLLGITPSDVPALMFFADRQKISLTDMNRDLLYEDAALSAAGSFTHHFFADWDQDGYRELLTLTAEGKLTLHGLEGSWKVLSSADTGLTNASLTVTDEKTPVILVLSQNKDEFAVFTVSQSGITVLFRETGISRFTLTNASVTFSRLLKGSIERYNDYTYKASGAEIRPVRTGIDWQKNDYPMPESAEAAILRFFEARVYDIPEEAALLTKGESASEWPDVKNLTALPLPLAPVSLTASAYHKEENQSLFEVTYSTEAGSFRTWMAAEYADGWKISGAADTFGMNCDPGAIDASVSLLCLNNRIHNTLPGKGSRSTYRILVPQPGRLRLVWQSGTKAVSRTSHTVTLQQTSLTGDNVFSYELQPSPNRQQSKDMFVSAGVYYLSVEAHLADPTEYELEIVFEKQANVELENNDTADSATPLALNAPYSGALSGAKDIDFFTFTLPENSAADITLKSSGNGSKSPVYTYAIYNAATGSRLSSVSMPGNVPLTQTGNLYLSNGTYLVQVAKGSAFTNDEYILTVNVSRNGFMESEDNNTPETADAVPVNEDVHASIGQEGDIDCYTFTLDGDAVVQPRFTFRPTDSASKTYVLTLTDISRRELLKANIGGKESTKVIAPVALTAGTYTVKIENPRFIRQDYVLHMVSMSVDTAEKEPNDSLALASSLHIGAPCTGVLTTEADVDYYRLTFAKDTTVTLRFSFAQSTNTSTVFVLCVEQNGKTQWTANIKGDTGGTEQQLRFPAGEYYIKVKPSTWLSAVYTIAVD